MNKHCVLYILFLLQFGFSQNFEKPPRRLIDAPLNGHESKHEKKEVNGLDRQGTYDVNDNESSSSSEELDKIKIEEFHMVTSVTPAITGKPGLPGEPGLPGMPEIITQPLPETLKKPTTGNYPREVNKTIIEEFQIITPGSPIFPGNPGLPGLPGRPGMPSRPDPPKLLISEIQKESKKPYIEFPQGPPIPLESTQLLVVNRCVLGIPGTPGLPGQPGTPGTPGIGIIVGRNVDVTDEVLIGDNRFSSYSRNNKEGRALKYLENNIDLWKINRQSNGYSNQERRKQFSNSGQQGNEYETISSSGKYEFIEIGDSSGSNTQNVNMPSSNSINDNYPSSSSGYDNQRIGNKPWSSSQYGDSIQSGNYQKPVRYPQTNIDQWTNSGNSASDGVSGTDDYQQSTSSQWPSRDTGNRIQPDNNFSSESNQQTSNTLDPYKQTDSYTPFNNAQQPGNYQQTNKWSNEWFENNEGDSNQNNNNAQWPSKQTGVYTPSDSNFESGSFHPSGPSFWQNGQPDSYSSLGNGQPTETAQQNSYNSWSNGQLDKPSQSGQQSGFYQPTSFNQWISGQSNTYRDPEKRREFENPTRPDFIPSINSQPEYFNQGDDDEIVSNVQWQNKQPEYYKAQENRQIPDNQEIDASLQSGQTDMYSPPINGLTEDVQGTYQNQNVELQAIPYQPLNPYAYGPHPLHSSASSHSDNGVSSASSQFLPGSGSWRPMYPGYPSYSMFRPGYPSYQPGYMPYRPGIYQPGYPTYPSGYPYQPGYPTYQPGTPGGFTNPGAPQVSNYPIG